ncbi:FCD domain-containing protein [Phenylobacterium sp. LjRoot164]|uniref:FadR/GntR family transcriptional regulator n=1 Tax=unclassified Phenylobacterium TaxID=2640670 RepID=UPI003ECCA265
MNSAGGKSASILAQLRRRVQRLGPGSRLPAERRLAEELACSRETLRTALATLEVEGLVWRHVGQGTFTGPRPQSEPIGAAVLFAQSSPADLMAARLVIEPAVAAAAAKAASASDIARLRELALATRAASDWRAYEAGDEAFHRGLATATGNKLLVAVLAMVSSVRGRGRWQRRHDAAFLEAHGPEYSRVQGGFHLAIVEAVAARDSETAETLMREHLTQIAALMSPSA